MEKIIIKNITRLFNAVILALLIVSSIITLSYNMLSSSNDISFIIIESFVGGLSCNDREGVIAIGDYDGNVTLYNYLNQSMKRVSFHPHEIYSVSWSPNGDLLAVGGSEGLVALVTKNGEVLWSLDIGGSIGVLSWSPNSELLVAVAIYSSSTSRIYVISPENGTIKTSIEVSSPRIVPVVWINNHTIVFGASNNITVLDIDKGVQLWSSSIPGGATIRTLYYKSSLNLIFAGDIGGYVHVVSSEGVVSVSRNVSIDTINNLVYYNGSLFAGTPGHGIILLSFDEKTHILEQKSVLDYNYTGMIPNIDGICIDEARGILVFAKSQPAESIIVLVPLNKIESIATPSTTAPNAPSTVTVTATVTKITTATIKIPVTSTITSYSTINVIKSITSTLTSVRVVSRTLMKTVTETIELTRTVSRTTTVTSTTSILVEKSPLENTTTISIIIIALIAGLALGLALRKH